MNWLLNRLKKGFTRRGQLIVPHVEMPLQVDKDLLSNPDAKDISHPLEAVMIGPVPEPRLTIAAVKDFLASRTPPINASVVVSKAPLRY